MTDNSGRHGGVLEAAADSETSATSFFDAPAASLQLPMTVTSIIAGLAWLASGHVVAVPIAALSAIALLAAVIDARISRIPNRASLWALAITAGSIPIVVLVDDRPFLETALGVLGGLLYSGAPLLFAIWLVRPESIGGGDWKLLGVLGAGVGLALPVGALVMATLACTFQVVIGIVRRRRSMAFAPSIAAALAVTLVLLPVLNTTFGGPYS